MYFEVSSAGAAGVAGAAGATGAGTARPLRPPQDLRQGRVPPRSRHGRVRHWG